MEKVKCPLCNNWNDVLTNENDFSFTKCECSARLTWNEDRRWEYLRDRALPEVIQPEEMPLWFEKIGRGE
jgi:hypothetical protein